MRKLVETLIELKLLILKICILKREKNEQPISESNGLKGNNALENPDDWTTGNEPM